MHKSEHASYKEEKQPHNQQSFLLMMCIMELEQQLHQRHKRLLMITLAVTKHVQMSAIALMKRISIIMNRVRSTVI